MKGISFIKNKSILISIWNIFEIIDRSILFLVILKSIYYYMFDYFNMTILYLFQLNMITTNIYDCNTVTQVAVINLNFACLVFIHFNVLLLLLPLWCYFTKRRPEKEIGLTLICCVASSNFYALSSYQIIAKLKYCSGTPNWHIRVLHYFFKRRWKIRFEMAISIIWETKVKNTVSSTLRTFFK